MDLSEKIQTLRKLQGLTQEQFAEQLFVSRTAVSKWETGRGMPSMESLQLIAKLCNVTLDELLQAEEIITIAQNENKENISRFADHIDGMIDIAAITAIFLPLYKVELDQVFFSVPLYQFNGWLSAFYWFFPIAMALCGAIRILHKGERTKQNQILTALGFLLNVCAIFLLILSGQPYPAALFFALLLFKGALLLLKQR